MTQNAIDFRELRRRERQRVRSAVNTTNTGGCASDVDLPNEGAALQNGAVAPSKCDDSEHSLSPYESLLPGNRFSEDAHRIGDIRSVFYSPSFLSPAQAKDVLSWLQSCPECTQQSANPGTCDMRQSEREESIRHNGKWTRLKHARRKVALFDGTICKLPPILQRIANTLVAHYDGDGDATTLSIRPEKHQPTLEVILHGCGSLIVFADDAYLNHCHEIREVLEETTSTNGICGNDVKGGTLIRRGHRVSLTFRHKK
ncbi:hypothetical protein ACHAXT_010444 [Thalassiosira profunda]